MSLGDMLQHFLTVIFNKLDKGETWDDDFELNTILQVHLINYISLLFGAGQQFFGNVVIFSLSYCSTGGSFGLLY